MCRDGGLELVGTGRAIASSRVQDRHPFADQVRVPAAAVLLFEGDQVAVVIGAGGAPCVVEQHERKQPERFGFVRHQVG